MEIQSHYDYTNNFLSFIEQRIVFKTMVFSMISLFGFSFIDIATKSSLKKVAKVIRAITGFLMLLYCLYITFFGSQFIDYSFSVGKFSIGPITIFIFIFFLSAYFASSLYDSLIQINFLHNSGHPLFSFDPHSGFGARYDDCWHTNANSTRNAFNPKFTTKK